MRYSNHKDYNDLVANVVQSGKWQFFSKNGHKHACIKNVANGRRLAIPVSPSDTRGLLNLKAQIRRLERIL